MTTTTTWRHNFTNYDNMENINASGLQHLEIYQPVASKKIRLQLNNLYDEIPLRISDLKIYTNPEQKVPVTLDGETEFNVLPRLSAWSDWIDFDLPQDSYLAIDLKSPNKTVHTFALTISNELIRTENLDPTVPKYFFGISGIQVETVQEYVKIAFFGDSLTNQGNFTAPLAKSLESKFNVMTANFGISGNRLLHPGHSTSQWSTSFGEEGLTRFDHMLVDYRPNIVIFMEGTNDLLHPGTGAPIDELPSAEAIVKAAWMLKAKCKQRDITFVPMTVTPANGNVNDGVAGWSEVKEDLRLALNDGLRKMPHILDLATLTSENGRLKPEFDCGDHVHFSVEGGKIIAKYIEDQLIRKKMI